MMSENSVVQGRSAGSAKVKAASDTSSRPSTQRLASPSSARCPADRAADRGTFTAGQQRDGAERNGNEGQGGGWLVSGERGENQETRDLTAEVHGDKADQPPPDQGGPGPGLLCPPDRPVSVAILRDFQTVA